MRTHTRRKIEIIIDAPLAPRVTALIDRLGATGYTLFQSIGGRGAEGEWREDQLTGAQQKVLIKIIANDQTADTLVESLAAELERYSCIIYVSTVEVVRAGKF
jgi:nitrogen regulatory protein PII